MINKSCVTCLHWKGRTDLNKCKLYPDTIPDWSLGCVSWYLIDVCPICHKLLSRLLEKRDDNVVQTGLLCCINKECSEYGKVVDK
jgi:hypothetical protein